MSVTAPVNHTAELRRAGAFATGWWGNARFLVEAIRQRDYPIVQNLVMFIAFVVVTINLLVDMTYVLIDPRIRYSD